MDDTTTWGVGEAREVSDVLDEYQRDEPRDCPIRDEFTPSRRFLISIRVYLSSFLRHRDAWKR